MLKKTLLSLAIGMACANAFAQDPIMPPPGGTDPVPVNDPSGAAPPPPTNDGMSGPSGPMPSGDGMSGPSGPMPTDDGMSGPSGPMPTDDGMSGPSGPMPTDDGMSGPSGPMPTDDGMSGPSGPMPSDDGMSGPSGPMPSDDGMSGPSGPMPSGDGMSGPSDSMMPHEPFNLSDEEFQEFSPEKMGQMQPKEMAELPSGKIQLMPPQAFNGLQAGHMEKMHGEVIHNMSREQMEQIPDGTVEQMSDDERAKVLGNLDPSTMRDQAERFLPEGWKLGEDNSIDRPEGAKIDPPAKPQKMTDNLQLPEMPDLSKGTGLGGELGQDGKSLGDSLNDFLKGIGFEANQGDDGVLDVKGPDGLQMAMAPDREGMKQGPKDAKPGLDVNEQGQFVLTLDGGVQMPVRPAPKDPEGAAKVLPGGGTLEMGDEGEVEMYMQQPPEGVPGRMGCKFDPQVMQAPEGMAPGVHKGDDGKMMMVYEDGTAQQMKPAIHDPEGFSNAGMNIPGIESITHNDDGTITVVLSGTPRVKAMLQPDYEIMTGDGQSGGAPIGQGDDGSAILDNGDGSFGFKDAQGRMQKFGLGDIGPMEDGETPPPGEGDQPPVNPPQDEVGNPGTANGDRVEV